MKLGELRGALIAFLKLVILIKSDDHHQYNDTARAVAPAGPDQSMQIYLDG